MSAIKEDTSWMDENEPGCRNCLTCHIEIDIESDDTFREILAKAVAGLRAIAGPLEAGMFDTGWHSIGTPGGEEIGKIYLDYSEAM